MARFTASDCPSDCGWKAELMYKRVPAATNKAFQNPEVNTTSLSEMMDVGKP
jgi:hypothetical protein